MRYATFILLLALSLSTGCSRNDPGYDKKLQGFISGVATSFSESDEVPVDFETIRRVSSSAISSGKMYPEFSSLIQWAEKNFTIEFDNQSMPTTIRLKAVSDGSVVEIWKH